MKTRKVECVNPSVCVACECCEEVDKTRWYVFVKCNKLKHGIHIDVDCVPFTCGYVCEHTVSATREKQCVVHQLSPMGVVEIEKKLIQIDVIKHIINSLHEGCCDACRRPWDNPRIKCTCRKKRPDDRIHILKEVDRLKELHDGKIPKDFQKMIGLEP